CRRGEATGAGWLGFRDPGLPERVRVDGPSLHRLPGGDPGGLRDPGPGPPRSRAREREHRDPGEGPQHRGFALYLDADFGAGVAANATAAIARITPCMRFMRLPPDRGVRFRDAPALVGCAAEAHGLRS